MGYKFSAVTGQESLLPSYTFEIQKFTDHSLIYMDSFEGGLA